MSRPRPQLEKQEALGLVLVLAIGLTSLASTLDLDLLTDVFAIVGFVLVLPLVGILGDRLPFVASTDEGEPESAPAGDGDDESDEPIAELRDRYARGEIDEAEFERRLEQLLETADVEAAPESERDRAVEPE